MTKMLIDRSVVEQALEALNVYASKAEHRRTHADDCAAEDAITALRAALAQQAESVEPVAWLYTGIKQDGTEHGPHLVWKPEYMDAMSASKGAKATPLYFAPPRQVEPVEPVVGVVLNEEGRAALVEHGREEWHCAARNARRLYTAPPQRKPLTDEKISDLWCEVSNTDFVTADTHVFARAVERAHGIGRQSDPQIEDRLARHGIPKP